MWKNILVTADSGIDSMIVVWDSNNGSPKRTYFNPYENGVCSLDLSKCWRYLVTTSNDAKQSISLWDLENQDLNEPIITTLFKFTKGDKQTVVKFNPSNVHELVCHGERQLAFLSWEDDGAEFEYYLPIISVVSFTKKEKAYANLTSTVFIPGTLRAVSSTDKGDLLVWDVSLILDGIAQPNEKRLTKVLELHQDYCAINTLAIHEQYLVTGNSDGSIRFYDFELKIWAWFENLELAEIKAISFADLEATASGELNESGQDEFKCSDFIVADANAQVCKLESTIFEELEPDKKKAKLIFEGLKSSINCIAAHPSEPILAIGGSDGLIMLWNYFTKEKTIKKFSEEPKCLEYSPDGKYLMNATNKGLIRILDPLSMKEVQAPWKISENNLCPINMITVASDSQHFATMDAKNWVCLFKRDHKYGDIHEEIEWIFYGNVKSHEIEITSIAFGESLDEKEEPLIQLFSIGKDRNLVVYNVRESSEKKGLIVDNTRTMMIEQENIPTSWIWYPTLDSKEDLLLTVNDGYKMKIWNVTSSQCRKTCLGPTYGGEIHKLK